MHRAIFLNFEYLWSQLSMTPICLISNFVQFTTVFKKTFSCSDHEIGETKGPKGEGNRLIIEKRSKHLKCKRKIRRVSLKLAVIWSVCVCVMCVCARLWNFEMLK